MKRLLSSLALVLFASFAAPAFAGGYGHHHHGHGGNGHRSGGWGNHWVGPVLGAAIVGSAIYAATSPAYAVAPPVVTMAPPAPRVAYFCSTSQQFYPNVPTCNVPWQLVNY